MRAFILGLIIFASLLTSGCAGALVALQAAGYAKTAYDYHEVVMPEQRVSYSEINRHDLGVENRILQRLENEGLLEVATVDPTSISGHVYLVGAFADRQTAERARELTKATPGVKHLTCSFLLSDPTTADTETSREAARSIRSRLATFSEPFAHVRVSVLEDNAWLMGSVNTNADKNRVESLAWDTEGVRMVRSYLAVRQQ